MNLVIKLVIAIVVIAAVTALLWWAYSSFVG